MNNDLRQQILVSLRAEGVGEADRAREALALLTAEMQKAVKSFSEGNSTGSELHKTISGLSGQFNFFSGLVKASEESVGAIDIGLHKLQMTAIKFGDDYAAAMEKAAQAADALELKEAERLAKLAADYEKFLEKQEADNQGAAIKEAERQAKLLADYEKSVERKQASDEAAELKEAERLARLAAGYEKYVERQNAAADQVQVREAERQAKLLADYEAYLARRDAASEQEELEEAERLAKLAADHEKYLEREEAAEKKAATEIAAARASLNMQKRDSLEANLVNSQKEILATQRLIVGMGETTDHSHDKANRFGLAILNVSHAFQDLNYGIGAVLNNIPLIMTSFGFGPGAAGAVMAMGVAVEMLRGQLGGLASAMGMADDPTKKLGSSIDEVKAKIEAISGKTFKFAIDYQELDAAEARLRMLQKLKGLIDGTAETDNEKSLSKIAQDIAVQKAGGSDALQKAVGDIEATRGVDHASPTDVNIVNNANMLIEKARERQKSEGPIMSAVTEGVITELTRRRDAAQENINKARGGFVDEEVGKFLAGDPGAIARMKGRVSQFPGAFTGVGGKAILEMPGSPDELQRINDQKLAAEQARQLDQANFEEHQKFLEGERKRNEKRAREAVQAGNARKQAIDAQVGRFDNEFAQAQGEGSLNAQILNRIRGGASNAAIINALHGSIKGRLVDVPEEIVDEVVSQLIDKATGKIRAQIAAVGIEGIDAENQGKLKRAQDAAENRGNRAANRVAKQLANENELNLARDIFNETGGQIGQQGAMAAAHRAMQSMKQGVDFQTATMEAIVHTMAQLSGMGDQIMADQMRINDQLNGVQRQLRMQGAQQRRNRAQRPGVLPFFP